MKNVKVDLPFESLPNYQYMNYIDKARIVHNMGLHLDKNVIELGKEIYLKEIKNEDNSN